MIDPACALPALAYFESMDRNYDDFLDQVQSLSAKDVGLDGILPRAFIDRFEIVSYRNAARILSSAAVAELNELIHSLMAFHISTPEMVAGGGNKSQIAKNMDALLNPKGWFETRIRADMLIEKIVTRPNPAYGKRREKRTIVSSERFKILKLIDGHKIDFVKKPRRVRHGMEQQGPDVRP